MKAWAEELTAQIDKKLEGVKDKDLRFFRIDEFKRNITRVSEFSATCPCCQNEKKRIEEAVNSIDEAVKNVGKKRREYDKLITRLAKHMQKEHGFYAPYYFTYMYSFWGIVGGLVLGYFLMKINPAIQLELFCIGFAVGLLPTYVLGHLRDKKIRKAKKLM